MGMNSKIRLAGWALCVLAGVSAFGASAQSASPIKVTNSVFQEVDVKAPDGKVSTKLVPAAKVVPGAEVQYSIEYTNTGKQAATDLAIDNPVPAQLVFMGADKTPTTQVSVDGGNHYGELGELTVRGADGKQREAQLSDVTNLRWIVSSLAPGASGKVWYRARVK
jgi:uncharacterized repeat protein (TIGR01451 family)